MCLLAMLRGSRTFSNTKSQRDDAISKCLRPRNCPSLRKMIASCRVVMAEAATVVAAMVAATATLAVATVVAVVATAVAVEATVEAVVAMVAVVTAVVAVDTHRVVAVGTKAKETATANNRAPMAAVDTEAAQESHLCET